MQTLNAKQTIVIGVFVWVLLGLAFATGWRLGHASRPAGLVAVAMARGGQHQLLVYLPPAMAGAAVTTCPQPRIGGDCLSAWRDAERDGWKPVTPQP